MKSPLELVPRQRIYSTQEISETIARVSVLNFDLDAEIAEYAEDAVVIQFPIKEIPEDLVA